MAHWVAQSSNGPSHMGREYLFKGIDLKGGPGNDRLLEFEEIIELFYQNLSILYLFLLKTSYFDPNILLPFPLNSAKFHPARISFLDPVLVEYNITFCQLNSSLVWISQASPDTLDYQKKKREKSITIVLPQKLPPIYYIYLPNYPANK